MELSAQQLEQFDRDGFLVFPDLFARNEVAVLRREVARLARCRARKWCASIPAACAPSSACTRPTAHPLAAVPRPGPHARLLRPVQQVLKDDGVYVYHTKINTKPAIEGTVWQWHQDYGSWMRDGCRRPDMATFNVMMTDTTEMGGALYLIPGSHKLGRIEPVYDGIDLLQVLGDAQAAHDRNPEELAEPVAVTGRAGTCVLFHCNVLHASGHNLSADDRWHIYVSCNTVANRPQLGDNPRPDWVVSRNWNPLPIEGDQGVLKAA